MNTLLKSLAFFSCILAINAAIGSIATLGVMGLPRRRYFPLINHLLDNVWAVEDQPVMLLCRSRSHRGYVAAIHLDAIFSHHAVIKLDNGGEINVSIPRWHPIAKKFNKLMRLHREGRDSEFVVPRDSIWT
jgi:hypothetical protein